jgi:hypothetical protein
MARGFGLARHIPTATRKSTGWTFGDFERDQVVGVEQLLRNLEDLSHFRSG